MQDTTFVAIAIVVSIISIIAIMVIRMRILTAEQRRVLDIAYYQALREHRLSITQGLHRPGRILALDSRRGVLLYLDNSEGAVRKELIPLHQVADSRIVEKRKRSGRGGEGGVHKVLISLRLKSGSKVELPVYSEQADGIGERIPLTRVAEHWQLRLKRALTGRPEPYLLEPAVA